MIKDSYPMLKDGLVISVDCIWRDKGLLIFSPARLPMGWSPTEFKLQLFAWHEPSFYGTMLSDDVWKGRAATLLPPLIALDFFEHLPESGLSTWVWSENIRGLQRLAPILREIIREGRFRPDFRRWKNGSWGWKIEPAAGDRVSRDANEWVSAVINEYVSRDRELGPVWQKAKEKYQPPAKARQSTTFIDEEDWLTAIGWQPDLTPFRTCLRLMEPEDGPYWSLQVVLQDKGQPELILPMPGAESDWSAYPASWQDFRDVPERVLAKWQAVLPEVPFQADLAELTDEQAWEFLTHSSGLLAEAGYTVFLPAWWEQMAKAKPKLRAKTRSMASGGSPAWFGLHQIVQFDWKVAIGNLEITEEEFRRLVQEKKHLTKIQGQWVQLDPGMLLQVQKLLREKQKGMSLGEVLHLHLAQEQQANERKAKERLAREEADEQQGDGPQDVDAIGVEARNGTGLVEAEDAAELDRVLIEVELGAHLARLMKQLQDIPTIPREAAPSTFRGELRPYQGTGFSWMLFMRRLGLGCCLADDMGLGKTIQWVAYLLHLKEQRLGHTGSNPENQTGSPAVSTPALLICPTSVIGNWQMELKRFAPSLRVFVHYGPQRNKDEQFLQAISEHDLVITSYTLAHLDRIELGQVNWDCICLDEAQNIKNAYTKQSVAIRHLQGRHKVALTGTPMENRLAELWSIMDFLNPGYLGSLASFNRNFVSNIEKNRDEATVRYVRKLVHPFLLRRLKTDPAIELDLPEKQEFKEFVTLTPEQASLYENTLSQLFEKVEETTGIERRGLILSTLTRLKQICNHPGLGEKEGRLVYQAGRSAKLDRLVEMVEELRQEGDRCLIFTQYLGMGQLIENTLKKRLGEKVQFLHGGTPRQQRDTMIAAFQQPEQDHPEAFGIFVLSLKAGGIGLNLTAANHVFHVDRWWNPAVENQATDRAYRIGQHRRVQVHKFISLGTLEERIDQMLEQKQGLNELVVGKGESWITEMSTQELREIFTLRREWVEV